MDQPVPTGHALLQAGRLVQASTLVREKSTRHHPQLQLSTYPAPLAVSSRLPGHIGSVCQSPFLRLHTAGGLWI